MHAALSSRLRYGFLQKANSMILLFLYSLINVEGVAASLLRRRLQKRDDGDGSDPSIIDTVVGGLSDVSPLLSLVGADNMGYVVTASLRGNGASFAAATGAMGTLGAAQAGLKVFVGKTTCERLKLEYGDVVDLQTCEVEKATSVWLHKHKHATFTRTRLYRIDMVTGIFEDDNDNIPLVPDHRAHLACLYSLDGISYLSDSTIRVYNQNLHVYAVKYSAILILVGVAFTLAQIPLVINDIVTPNALILSQVGATGIALAVVVAAIRNKRIGGIVPSRTKRAVLKIDEYIQDDITVRTTQIIYDNIYEAILNDDRRGDSIPIFFRVAAGISAVCAVGGFVSQIGRIPSTTTGIYMWYGIQLALVVVRSMWLGKKKKLFPALPKVQVTVKPDSLFATAPLKDTEYITLLKHAIEDGTVRISNENGFTIVLCNCENIPIPMRELWVSRHDPEMTSSFRCLADLEGLKALGIEPRGPGIHLVVQMPDHTRYISPMNHELTVFLGEESLVEAFREGSKQFEWSPPLSDDGMKWTYGNLSAGQQAVRLAFNEDGKFKDLTGFDWEPGTDDGRTVSQHRDT